MAIKNTVETIGDAALADSFLDRSITELSDSFMTEVGGQAFRGCKALKNVAFENVTKVGVAAFWECTALEKAEFYQAAEFAANVFYGCTGLTALILRSTDAVCTMTGSLSDSTPIAKGTGYIYVPRALVDTYKAASGWSTYASQIRAIEDYSAKLDPYSWESVAANIADGSYASVYKVGDLVPLDMGSEGMINMQIAAIDTDDLADGSGKAPITWIGKELLKTSHRMNPAIVTNDDGTYQEGTGGVGGWEKCEMRAYLNDTILPMIPADVRGMIKPVIKYSAGYNTSGTAVDSMASTDSVWIPGWREAENINSNESKCVYYKDLFKTSADRKKNIVGSTKSSEWWYRSATGKNSVYCGTSGSSYTGPASSLKGIALCFCT